MNPDGDDGVKTRGATSRLLLLSYIKTHERWFCASQRARYSFRVALLKRAATYPFCLDNCLSNKIVLYLEKAIEMILFY